MAVSSGGTRGRYPVRALLLVVMSGALFFFNMTVGFLFMALVPPLIPVYVCVLFDSGSLVGNALAHARRVSLPAPAAMLRRRHDQEVGSRTVAPRAA